MQLIRWDVLADSFEPGQWLKGRIYERRCDLSPSGQFLIYFAANQKPPYRTWTAISRPPYLTALVLWPNGSTWGGGGLFDDENTISLNQRGNPADGFVLPSAVRVQQLTAEAFHQGGFGIYQTRLRRDGWKQVLATTGTTMLFDAEVFSRRLPGADTRPLELEMWMSIGDDWQYKTEYFLKDPTSNAATAIEKATWADFDPSGDLLFARAGRLFRAKPNLEAEAVFDLAGAAELYDFNSIGFAEMAAPDWARRWG